MSLFEFSEEDLEEINQVILKVTRIIQLKKETVQDINKKYLKPIMTQKDYKHLDKVLNNQLELKAEREVVRYKETLEEKNKYTLEEIIEKVKDQEIKIRDELGLKKKKQKNKEEKTRLTLSDLIGGIKYEELSK